MTWRQPQPAGLNRSQFVTLPDFLQDRIRECQTISSTSNKSQSRPTLDKDLDIEAICSRYNITDLVPESTKWVNLSKRTSASGTMNQNQGTEAESTTDPVTLTSTSPPPTPSVQSSPPRPDDIDIIDVEDSDHSDIEVITETSPPPAETLPKPECKLCHKVFKTRIALKKHRRIYHKKETPPPPLKKSLFLCTICGNRFESQEILNCHDRIHQRGRKYGCDICGLRFSLLSEAKAHGKAHTGERPFGCLSCGLAFRLGSSLTLHMKRKHYQDQGTVSEDQVKMEEPEVITLL